MYLIECMFVPWKVWLEDVHVVGDGPVEGLDLAGGKFVSSINFNKFQYLLRGDSLVSL